jgi:hydroxypyruvate isomerase
MEQIELKYQAADESAIHIIFEELKKAEIKFPGWPVDPVHGAGIMAEEAGEAVRAALDLYYGRGCKGDLIKEIAQTGAMAIRFLIAMLRKRE